MEMSIPSLMLPVKRSDRFCDGRHCNSSTRKEAKYQAEYGSTHKWSFAIRLAGSKNRPT